MVPYFLKNLTIISLHFNAYKGCLILINISNHFHDSYKPSPVQTGSSVYSLWSSFVICFDFFFFLSSSDMCCFPAFYFLTVFYTLILNAPNKASSWYSLNLLLIGNQSREIKNLSTSALSWALDSTQPHH